METGILELVVCKGLDAIFLKYINFIARVFTI